MGEKIIKNGKVYEAGKPYLIKCRDEIGILRYCLGELAGSWQAAVIFSDGTECSLPFDHLLPCPATEIPDAPFEPEPGQWCEFSDDPKFKSVIIAGFIAGFIESTGVGYLYLDSDGRDKFSRFCRPVQPETLEGMQWAVDFNFNGESK